MLPAKLRSGQKFIPAVSAKINQIIDYLKTQRLVSDNKTIKINQLVSGVALSAVVNPPGSPGGSGGSQLNHPFKLYFGTYSQGEQNEEEQTSQKVLHIQTGYLQMNGDDECRIAISYEEQNELTPYLELPDEEGQYIVTLMCWYDPQNEDSQMGWVTRVVFLTQDITVTDVISSCGFFYIMLGNILVQQNEDNELTYQITKQLVFSDFAVFDGNIKYPFKARFMMEDNEYPDDGDIIDQPIKPSYLVINPGKVYINGEYCAVNMQYHQLGDNPFEKYYLLQINTFTNTATIAIARLQDYVYTEDQIIYNIPLCRLIIDSNSIYGIIQYIDNNFCFTLNDRKVFLNQDDEIPKYLEQKYIIPTEDDENLTPQQQSFYSAFPNNSYLKAIRYSETSTFSLNSLSSGSSVEEIELTGYYDQLYWNYQGIPSYNSDSSSSVNLQTIYNERNSLKWYDYGRLRVNADDPNPDYLNTKFVNGQWIFKKVTNNYTLKVWTKALKKGQYIKLTDGLDNDDEEKPTVTIDWDYKGINGWSSSSATSNLQTIVNNSGSLKWDGYGKIRVDDNDTNPGFLNSKFVNGQWIFKKVENNTLKVWTNKAKQGYNIRLTNQGVGTETPEYKIDGYKTTLTATNGLKKDETKTNENFTIVYDIEVDYPNFALSVDSSIAGLLSLEKTTGGIKIKSALQGSGILVVSNGSISVLPAGSGNVVLGCSNGTFTWIPYADCDLACQSISSNSNSASSVGV